MYLKNIFHQNKISKWRICEALSKWKINTFISCPECAKRQALYVGCIYLHHATKGSLENYCTQGTWDNKPHHSANPGISIKLCLTNPCKVCSMYGSGDTVFGCFQNPAVLSRLNTGVSRGKILKFIGTGAKRLASEPQVTCTNSTGDLAIIQHWMAGFDTNQAVETTKTFFFII